MAGENTISSMDGLYHETWPDGGLDDLVPGSSVLWDLFDFDADSKLADSYHQGVVLSGEHGFTYNGSSGSVVTLSAAINATLKDAVITSSEIIGRSRLTYVAASRAAAAGKQAFAKAWGTVLMNLRKSSMKRLELEMLRGRFGIGEVESVSGQNVVLKPASWSPTTFAGLEGAKVDSFASQAATATAHDAAIEIDTVDYATRTIVFVSGVSATVANDFLYLAGTRTGGVSGEFKGMVSLIGIASNTGTLFGIDGSASTGYTLFRGNNITSFGQPTMGRVLAALTNAVDLGLEEKAYLLVPTKAWEVLNADLSGNRRFDGSYSRQKAENGSQAISYYGQVGELEVRTHPYLQRGEMIMFPKSPFKRVGSAELGFGVPGTDGRDIFFHDNTQNAVEARTFTDQGLFCTAPAQCVYITGVTYPT